MLRKSFSFFYPLLLNAIFILYLFFGHPFLLDQVNSKNAGPFTLILALSLFAAQGLEIAGLFLKRPILSHWMKSYPTQKGIHLFYIALVSLCHFLITFVVTFTAIEQIELLLTKQTLWTTLFFIVLVLAALTKEMLFFIYFSELIGIPLAKTRLTPTNMKNHSINFFGAMAGDLFLLFYAGLSFSIIWGSTITKSPIYNHGFLSLVGQYFGATLFFLMTYPSSRIISTFEQLMLNWPKRQKMINLLAFILTWISALLSISVK